MTEPTGVQQDLGTKLTEDFITRTYVLPIVRDEAKRRRLIEEHAGNPVGIPGRAGKAAVCHSPELARVLDMMRRQPLEGKYLILCRRQFEEYCIAVWSGVRGEPIRVLEDEVFSSDMDAEHAVFVRRLNELVAADEDR